MAKNEAMEKNTCNKVKELKKEFQKLAMQIIEEENEEDIINKAIKALYLLKDLKLKNNNKNNNYYGLVNSSHFDDFHVIIPNEFLCPISKQLIKDPVVLSTGQTYDRRFIQKWLKEGHRTCPQTQQVLSHTVLTPNHLVRELIAQWCKDNGIEYAPPVKDLDDDEFLTDDDRGYLNTLLERMSSTLSDQKTAAKEIRMLTKRMPSFRSFFGESTDAIPQLLTPLTIQVKLDDHPDLQEDLITALLNLSIHDNNKKVVAEHPLVIPLLVESLTCGTMETRTNAAAALFTLSALDSNKHLIGKSGALRPLIDLLEDGTPLAMKDAASAIFNLCVVVENRGRAVQDGAISVMLKKIMDRILVDELLAILAMLSSHQGAIEELGELGAVDCLLGLIRESSSDRNKENCIAILYSICIYDRAMLKEVREEERAHRTISILSENGTQRARRKAKGILDRLNRGINLTHTA